MHIRFLEAEVFWDVHGWRSASSLLIQRKRPQIEGCGELVAGILTGLMGWMLTELCGLMDRSVKEFPSVSGLFVRLKLAVLIRFPGFPDLGFLRCCLCGQWFGSNA